MSEALTRRLNLNFRKKTQTIPTLRILHFQGLYRQNLRDLREHGPRKSEEESRSYLLGLEVAGRVLGIPVSDNTDDLALGVLPPPISRNKKHKRYRLGGIL